VVGFTSRKFTGTAHGDADKFYNNIAADLKPGDLSADVACTALPRLRINPEFVERHAETPEHLLMPVMYELHQVLLGHTRQGGLEVADAFLAFSHKERIGRWPKVET
jgi:hypothetical protein